MWSKNRNRKWGQPERRGKISKILVSLLILSAILLFLSSPFSRVFSRMALYFAIPVWQTKNALTVSSKNGSLKADHAAFNAVSREIFDLRALLGRGAPPNLLLGSVLSESSTPLFDVLHVDVGEKDGVHVGDSVIGRFDEENASSTAVSFSIGIVAEASSFASKVKLFSSPGEKTSVFLGPENIAVTLLGRGGGAMTVELPKDVDIRVGDTALLPGVSGHIVSTVTALEPDPSLSFMTVYLRLGINPAQLRYVGILLSTGENE